MKCKRVWVIRSAVVNAVGETYSELRGPHLSQGSFLLTAEGTWEMSRMSSSVQQLSVSGKDRQTFQSAHLIFI